MMDRPAEPGFPISSETNATADERDAVFAEAAPDASRSMAALRAALFAQTPRAWATPLVVAANLAVFVWMVVDGVDPFWPSGPQQIAKLIGWGANFPPYTVDGQWWRLGSAMFLHFGLLHIGMNMLALWQLGRLTERLCGGIGFLVLYAATGLIGSLGTVYYALFHTPAVSAGASGAIFGIAGVQLGYVFRQRRRLPPEFVAAIRWLGLNVVVFLAIFQFVPLVDNAAHIAGFLAGLAGGLAVSQPVSPAARRRRWWRNLLVLGGGAAAVTAGVLAYPSDWSDFATVRARVERLDEEATREIETILDRYEQGASSATEAADRLESDVLPRLDEILKRLDGVDRVAPEDEDQLADDRELIAEKRAGVVEQIAALRHAAAH